MSLKPRKISDEKKELARYNAKMNKRKKTVLDDLPPYTFIVSEGIKTEVAYISGFARAINKKFSKFSTSEYIMFMAS